jgi:enoyl-CoA hydratase
MSTDVLQVEVAEGIATLTINRPEVLNALDDAVKARLDEVLAALERDPAVGAVILTGTGDRAFVSGADVRALAAKGPQHRLAHGLAETFWALEHLPQPTIAAVNGYALGGGCELALACDLRIASERARFGQPEVNLGILPGAGGTQRLARLVGIGKAKELIFTGTIIDAAEAKAIGLVNEVVPHGDLLGRARAVARLILSKGPLAVRLAKAAITVGMADGMVAGLAFEKMAQAFLFTTADRAEGMRAFLEKRPPRFRGE